MYWTSRIRAFASKKITGYCTSRARALSIIATPLFGRGETDISISREIRHLFWMVLVHQSYSRTFQEKSKITEKMKSKSTAVVSASRSIDLCMVPKSVTF